MHFRHWRLDRIPRSERSYPTPFDTPCTPLTKRNKAIEPIFKYLGFPSRTPYRQHDDDPITSPQQPTQDGSTCILKIFPVVVSTIRVGSYNNSRSKQNSTSNALYVNVQVRWPPSAFSLPFFFYPPRGPSLHQLNGRFPVEFPPRTNDDVLKLYEGYPKHHKRMRTCIKAVNTN